MRTKIYTALVVSVIVAGSSVSANAEKLCIKTSVNKNTLKATTVSAIASTCPAGYTAIADTAFLTGPKGETGMRSHRNSRPSRNSGNSRASWR